MTFEYFPRAPEKGRREGFWFGLRNTMGEWLITLQSKESKGLVLLGVVRGSDRKVKIWRFGFDAEYGSVCTGCGMSDRVRILWS